ncbi:MAG: hypothetical protein M3347_10655 [Armatimonadota bacterium]|nr:hypothetical protein [Armatimonadota bacterium]
MSVADDLLVNLAATQRLGAKVFFGALTVYGMTGFLIELVRELAEFQAAWRERVLNAKRLAEEDFVPMEVEAQESAARRRIGAGKAAPLETRIWEQHLKV